MKHLVSSLGEDYFTNPFSVCPKTVGLDGLRIVQSMSKGTKKRIRKKRCVHGTHVVQLCFMEVRTETVAIIFVNFVSKSGWLDQSSGRPIRADRAECIGDPR